MSKTIRSITKVKGFKDHEMDFQLLRQLGSVAYGGASIGESLAIVENVKHEIASELSAEFVNLGEKQHRDAQFRLNKNHNVSAREQFLKACNSFRAAEYFTPIDDPKHIEFGIKSRESFLQYLNLTPFYTQIKFINYHNLQLPYYFIAPDKAQQPRKTIIIINGFDGTIEESFIQSGLAAINRGYNVVCFAGPGQMDSLRFNLQTYFEPDFENPVKQLLDVLENNPLINFSQLALLGFSFGGYLASRACCYESRIKALIANSPITDLKKYVLGFYAEENIANNNIQDFSYKDIVNIPDEVIPPSLKDLIGNLLLRFGNRSMVETLSYLNKFNIHEQMKQISCPTLALIGEGEGGEPLLQYQEFLKSIPSITSSSHYKFSIEDGADTHCQVTNLNFSNCVIYDWLDEIW